MSFTTRASQTKVQRYFSSIGRAAWDCLASACARFSNAGAPAAAQNAPEQTVSAAEEGEFSRRSCRTSSSAVRGRGRAQRRPDREANRRCNSSCVWRTRAVRAGDPVRLR